MRTNLERLATLALIIGLACLSMRFSSADDDQPEAAANGLVASVALLDVGRVFKECDAFKEEMEVIREELNEAQRSVAKQRQGIAILTAEHRQLTPGTRDHIDLGQEISTEEAKLKAKIERQKARTMSQEAEAYASHYDRLREVVDEYAKERGIRLVLRQGTDNMNPDDPKSVLTTLNRSVVFQDRLDITDDILAIINSN